MRKAFHKSTLGILALSVAVIVGLVSLSPSLAEEEVPTADFSVAFLSKYVWRGQELSKDSMVIQPSMTVGYKGFAANIWGNLDTDPYTPSGVDSKKEQWTETDLTLSYGRKFDMVSAEAGWIYYGLNAPYTGETSPDDTYELYLNLGLDVLLAPSLTIYRDISSAPHTYYLLGISHAFELSETLSLELAGSISYLSSDDVDEYPEPIESGGVLGWSTTEKFDNFHDGVISASLPIPAGKYFTITPSVSYVFPLSSDAEHDMKLRSYNGDDDSFFFGGITCTIAF